MFHVRVARVPTTVVSRSRLRLSKLWATSASSLSGGRLISERANTQTRSWPRSFTQPTFATPTKEAVTTHSEQMDAIIDNPCWGSPDRCSLSDLLTIVSQDKNILYESSNYLVLNKPADLRMDGKYPSTVHKLLTYWYPTPSLMQRLPAHYDTLSTPEQSKHLLAEVQQLHQHNDLNDNALRPCHQLDYATSGVLLVARSQISASQAMRAFESRRVSKTYLALLEGHIFQRDFVSRLEVVPESQIESTLAQIESTYRRSRHNRKKDTFQGFLPQHALFNKWKSVVQKRRKKKAQQQQQQQQLGDRQTASSAQNDHVNVGKKRRRQSSASQQQPLLSDDDWTEIWKSVQDIPEDTCMALKWKELIQHDPSWKVAFATAADKHNQILKQRIEDATNVNANASATEPSSFPTLFRSDANDQDTFYVAASLGQDGDVFEMKVHPELDTMQQKGMATDQLISMPQLDRLKGSDRLDYKPSLTKCRIVHEGEIDGRSVTKVELFPRTGRRHQLRVHTALIGHPILGDATYQNVRQEDEAMSNSTTQNNSNAAGRRSSDSSRMCLHAHSLSIAGLHEEKDDWKVVAVDPFIVDKHGVVSVAFA